MPYGVVGQIIGALASIGMSIAGSSRAKLRAERERVQKARAAIAEARSYSRSIYEQAIAGTRDIAQTRDELTQILVSVEQVNV